MSIILKNTSDVTLNSFPLVEGTISVVRVVNTGVVAMAAKMFLEGYDGKSVDDATNLEGKEIATEGWVSVRKTGDTDWVQIHAPSSFPDAFDDLTDGVFDFTIDAESHQDIDVKITVPDDAATSGIAHFAVTVMGAAS